MKIIAFIMAFLILALPVLPCADDGATPGKTKTEIVKHNSQPEEQEHNDACSPFCHCTCCAGFSIHYFSTAATSVIPGNSKLYSSYLHADIIDHSSPIWQPPKLLA